MRKTTAVVGQKFGELVLVELRPLHELKSGRKANALFHCTRCGKDKEFLIKQVRKAKTCGCWTYDHKGSGRKPPGVQPARSLFSSYRSVATRKEIAFDLSFEQFQALTQQDCFYCGAPPSSVKKGLVHGEYIWNGIDRVNSELGYVLSNCVPCCSICNRMKTDLAQDTFLKQVEKIAQHICVERHGKTL